GPAEGLLSPLRPLREGGRPGDPRRHPGAPERPPGGEPAARPPVVLPRRRAPVGGPSEDNWLGLPPGGGGDQSGSMKMHSPGHSSADSITASSCPSGMLARPSAPPGSLKTFEPSFTYARPSSSRVNTSGAISSQSPSPVQRSWSIHTFMCVPRFAECHRILRLRRERDL